MKKVLVECEEKNGFGKTWKMFIRCIKLHGFAKLIRLHMQTIRAKPLCGLRSALRHFDFNKVCSFIIFNSLLSPSIYYVCRLQLLSLVVVSHSVQKCKSNCSVWCARAGFVWVLDLVFLVSLARRCAAQHKCIFHWLSVRFHDSRRMSINWMINYCTALYCCRLKEGKINK